MKQLRIYADTSVFGGCFDEEFAEESRTLFEEIRAGKFLLVISATNVRELSRAPEQVREILATLPPECVEMIDDSDEIDELRDSYVAANVVGPASRGDAEHIAAASVAEADIVVSWNFRHIVHYDKISGYQAINLLKGYKPIRIHSPREVIGS